MKLSKVKFIKDSSYFLFTSLVTGGLGFITLPIYTRHLSPSDYGILVLFFLFGSTVVGIVSFGLLNSSYRYYFEYKSDLNKFRIFNTTNAIFTLIFLMIVGIFIYYSANWISKSLFNSEISPKLLQLSYIYGCLNYFIQAILLLLAAQLKSFTFAIISICKIVLDISLSFYFIFSLSLTYMARVNAILISQIVIIFCAFITVKHLFTNKLSFVSLKESLLYSYPNLPGSLIGLGYQSFDKVMIVNYQDMSSLGNYNIGEKFASVFLLITESINRVFTPYFQDNSHENSSDSRHNIVRTFYDLSGIYLLGAFAIICFSEELIKLLTTPEFYPSIFIAPIFVFYYLFGAILSMLSVNQIMYTKKLIFQIPVSVVSLTINISLNILLIPKYGAIGAVFSTAIAALASDCLLLYFGQRVYFLPLNYKKLVSMFLLIILFTVPVYLLMFSEIHYLFKILYKILFLFVFIFFLYKMSIFSSNIKKILTNSFPIFS